MGSTSHSGGLPGVQAIEGSAPIASVECGGPLKFQKNVLDDHHTYIRFRLSHTPPCPKGCPAAVAKALNDA